MISQQHNTHQKFRRLMNKNSKVTLKGLKTQIGSLNDLINRLRAGLRSYSYSVRNPQTKDAFGVVAYKENSAPQVSNTINVVELLTIVLTAQQLGKQVVVTAGSDPRKPATNLDRIVFKFVDQIPDLPYELRV